MSDVIASALPPKKENHELAEELLARFPGVERAELLKDMVSLCFYWMRWGNKREEKQACDFLNELQRIAIRNAGQTLAPVSLLADLVRAYHREVNPADDWTQTAMTKEEFNEATKEFRAAKAWLSANAEVSDGAPLTHESPAAQSRRSLH